MTQESLFGTPRNIERTGKRSLALSRLLRDTPPPRRHIDIDVLGLSVVDGREEFRWVAEAVQGHGYKTARWTAAVGHIMGIPSYLFRYTLVPDLDEIDQIRIENCWNEPLTEWMTKLEFSRWDHDQG